MKAPICSADMKRNALCKECQQKLEDGKISEIEVRVSRILHKLSRKFYFIDIEFRRAIELHDTIILLCKGNIGALIGRKGRVVGELNKELGKNVRIIEKQADEKKMIQDFLGNARVLAVNKVFKVDGKEHRIVIAQHDVDKLPAPQNEIKAGIERLLNTSAEIGFG